MTKPENFGQKRGKFGQFGKGQFIKQLPVEGVPIDYDDFSGGYNSSMGREGPANASSNMTDFEVSRKNRLVRAAGTQDLRALAGHHPYQVIQQTNLDGIVELIFFDAPSVGIERNGVVTWTNLNLSPARPFAYAQFGETLVFGNGAGPVYRKEPGFEPIAAPEMFQARSYAVFANRLYGVGATIEGNFEPMGIRWTGASSDPTDALGPGSGSELMISDASTGDEAVAARDMGLNYLAVICRQSVWVGTRTSDPFRPADMAPRIKGSGGLSDRTAVSYPMGVAYLSEGGIRSFDGNSAPVVSGPINGELLPLDLARINEYKLTFDGLKDRLILNTPTCTWIYSIEFKRWYRGSLIASDIVFPIAQIGGTTWAQLQAAGTKWSEMGTTTWRDLSPRSVGRADLMWLKYRGALNDAQTAKEDINEITQFGLDMNPFWETMRKDGERMNSLLSVHAILVEYQGSGSFRFYLPDRDGQLQPIMELEMQDSAFLRETNVPLINTGRGGSMMIQLIEGTMEINKFQLILEPRSPKYEIEPFAPREYRSDFNV